MGVVQQNRNHTPNARTPETKALLGKKENYKHHALVMPEAFQNPFNLVKVDRA